MITGVYPTEQEVIEIDGVRFFWSLLPPKIHRSIQNRLVQFANMTQEEVMKSGKMDEMLECFEDVVAFSVKAHTGLRDHKGELIPFKECKRMFRNEPYQSVDLEVLKVYYYSGIIEQLASKILEKSNLSGQDAKNSNALSAS